MVTFMNDVYTQNDNR